MGKCYLNSTEDNIALLYELTNADEGTELKVYEKMRLETKEI